MRARTAMHRMVRVEMPMGTHTGATQGTGIRKSTSRVVSVGGQRSSRYNEA
jgi:hypothetical protein